MEFTYTLVTCFRSDQYDEPRIWQQTNKADLLDSLRRWVGRKLNMHTCGPETVKCMVAIRSDGAVVVLNRETDEDWWEEWNRDELAIRLKEAEAALLSKQVEAT